MAIQKKSLISALKSAKNVSKPEGDAAGTKVVSTKGISARGVISAKASHLKSMTSLKRNSMKKLSNRAQFRSSLKAAK